ncbi:MAG: helix-turn-helix domain-containing protein [Propioniciclava sp.]
MSRLRRTGSGDPLPPSPYPSGCRCCGVSVDMLRRRVAAGHLPACRFRERHIRVRSEDLDRLFRPSPAGDWPCAVKPQRVLTLRA